MIQFKIVPMENHDFRAVCRDVQFGHDAVLHIRCESAEERASVQKEFEAVLASATDDREIFRSYAFQVPDFWATAGRQ